MPHARIGTAELYYEDHGSGPAVVFVHGAGGNHLSWWQQVPAFSRRYRCITYDQRGFGASREDAGGPGAAALADDLLGLLDHLGIERAHLVAQSLGGWATWGAAARHPGRVAALVMGGTVGSVPFKGFDAWLRSTHENAGDAPLRNAIPPQLAEERPDLAFLYWQIQGLNPAGGAAGPAMLEPLAARVEPVDGFAVPTLFIAGELDAMMPPDLIEEAASCVPGAQLWRVPGAGHSVYFEKADAFNARVLDFLDAA